MTDVTMKLRSACGHDSRSVEGCANCEAADEIERLRSLHRQAKTLIAECRAALAEELSAWDIDPPLHHVWQAHDRRVEWLARHNGLGVGSMASGAATAPATQAKR